MTRKLLVGSTPLDFFRKKATATTRTEAIAKMISPGENQHWEKIVNIRQADFRSGKPKNINEEPS
jgi:hypothetical protein